MTANGKWAGDAILEWSEPVLSALIGVSAEFNLAYFISLRNGARAMDARRA